MCVCTQHKTRLLNGSYLNKFGRYQFLIFASGDLFSYPKTMKCTGALMIVTILQSEWVVIWTVYGCV